MPHVLIIGGGAAGLAAAISAAQAGAQVTVMEKAGRIGTRILSTGNGRCNLSNSALDTSDGCAAYNDPAFVRPVLARVTCTTVREFFAGLGLLTVADESGRVYPRTNTAHSVLDVLYGAVGRLGVRVECGRAIQAITPVCANGAVTGYEAVDEAGHTHIASRLIIACGNSTFTQALDAQPQAVHVPVLGPLKAKRDAVKGLDGVRAACKATLMRDGAPCAQEEGELLFRDYGVSGIPAFDLSRYAQPGDTLSLDFFAEYSEHALSSLLEARHRCLAGISAHEYLDGLLHRRVALAVLRSLGIASDASAANLLPAKLASALKDYRLVVTGGPTRSQAQVMRGGYATSHVNAETMESAAYPGVFIVGEALDVDARCGGFNLHWAWASGLTAGAAVCE